MGILEEISAKIDLLIPALNENTAARLAGETGGGAAAADAPKKTRAKKSDDAPKTDEATLVAKFEALKAIDGNLPKLRKIIADAGFASLAELRQTPSKFDEVMAALQALEAAPAEDEDDL